MNGVVVTLVVLAILASRKGKKGPVKLDLGGVASPTKPPKLDELVGLKPEAANPDTAPVSPQSSRQGSGQAQQKQRQPPPGWENYRPRPKAQPHTQQAQPSAEPLPEKSLNVVFNWNGHSWDAYEVLGIPAGSSREAVTAAFHAMCGKSDPESLPFLTAAYEAILKS